MIFFFFNDTATTEIYTLSLHDALPISLRHAVVDLARRNGASDDVRTDLALAVGEACANVVVHAYPPGDVGPLIVHAEVKDGQIQIYVCDQGQGMTPRPDSPGLGLGLPLIANLADNLELGTAPATTAGPILPSRSARHAPTPSSPRTRPATSARSSSTPRSRTARSRSTSATRARA